MNNIPTSVNDNYRPKKKHKGLFFILVVIPISIYLFVYGINNIKIFNTHGHSMQPAINDNSFVVCIKSDDIKPGDIIAFTSRGETKIKRVIALSGDEINLDNKDQVLINNKILKEDYLQVTEFGEYEIPLPHTVADNSVFVLGDNRGNSLDSRHYSIGDINYNNIICEVKLVI